MEDSSWIILSSARRTRFSPALDRSGIGDADNDDGVDGMGVGVGALGKDMAVAALGNMSICCSCIS